MIHRHSPNSTESLPGVVGDCEIFDSITIEFTEGDNWTSDRAKRLSRRCHPQFHSSKLPETIHRPNPAL